jgi:hypothetical protein
MILRNKIAAQKQCKPKTSAWRHSQVKLILMNALWLAHPGPVLQYVPCGMRSYRKQVEI